MLYTSLCMFITHEKVFGNVEHSSPQLCLGCVPGGSNGKLFCSTLYEFFITILNPICLSIYKGFKPHCFFSSLSRYREICTSNESLIGTNTLLMGFQLAYSNSTRTSEWWARIKVEARFICASFFYGSWKLKNKAVQLKRIQTTNYFMT